MDHTSEKSELLKQFANWKTLQPDIKSPSHEEYNRGFSQFKEDIIEMGYRADFSSTRQFTSHRKIVGPVIAQIKKLIFVLIRPVMRVFLGPQVRFNHLVVNLAYRVAMLEKELHEIKAAKQIKETGK
jgi:hypothetical protein